MFVRFLQVDLINSHLQVGLKIGKTWCIKENFIGDIPIDEIDWNYVILL